MRADSEKESGNTMLSAWHYIYIYVYSTIDSINTIIYIYIYIPTVDSVNIMINSYIYIYIRSSRSFSLNGHQAHYVISKFLATPPVFWFCRIPLYTLSLCHWLPTDGASSVHTLSTIIILFDTGISRLQEMVTSELTAHNIYIYIYIYNSTHIPHGRFNQHKTCQATRKLNCRNFVKELVILFHQISAVPWGHGVHYKKSDNWRFPLFLPLPPLLATSPFVAALDGKRIWYLPPARTQERWTHVLS